jgi:hypothetical protein
MYYTGIGSRRTPSLIREDMEAIAYDLAHNDYTLRSGGADGADTAFEIGCDRAKGKKEIYLPWKGFNDNPSPLYEISEEAYAMAKVIYGSRWDNLKPAVKKLMARNMYQVTGKDLITPSAFVVCWTPDGCTTGDKRTKITGGTGQAIEYAWSLATPVFNLANKDAIYRLQEYMRIIGAIKW